jgi:hypothetical protein
VQDVVRRACECNELFAYGELLDVTNVRALEHASPPHWRTVQLFAYGTYDEYSLKPCDYLTLNESMLRKLRQLTILSMVAESKNGMFSLNSFCKFVIFSPSHLCRSTVTFTTENTRRTRVAHH